MPRRNNSKSLKISFGDMALISRSTDYTEYNSELVVESLKALLIPVSKLSKDDAIQWHLKDKFLWNAKRTARISNILKANKFSDRHKEPNPKLLFKKRAFLGWVK